ncbi:hypothetical protein ACET3Z_012215 [Daucus carota]
MTSEIMLRLRHPTVGLFMEQLLVPQICRSSLSFYRCSSLLLIYIIAEQFRSPTNHTLILICAIRLQNLELEQRSLSSYMNIADF